MKHERKAMVGKLIGGVVLGGLAAGFLTAMAVPTTMQQKADDWRTLIGVKEVKADEMPAIAFEAPPQDLTPVNWMTAQQEYPQPIPATYSPNSATLYDSSADLDLGDDGAIAPAEPLPTALIAARDTDRKIVIYDSDDAAAASANAASEAAADVRTIESAVAEPAAPASSDTPSPAVVSG